MDVVSAIGGYLSAWSSGGEAECRTLLVSSHSIPSDADRLDTLTAAYHALLSATLASWAPTHPLAPPAFVALVLSTLDALPSSSSKPPGPTPFAEVFVDTVWSVDAELDEIIAEAKTVIAGVDAETDTKPSPLVSRAILAKQNGEKDKDALVDAVKRLLVAGVLDTGMCRERLDLSLVAKVGLIADKNAHEKKEIRTRTGLFYKQNKFNLLREQSEGYSKLITELHASLGPPHSASTGHPVETPEQIAARAGPAWERVISLIGYFDLDPNRALDIILDIFSVQLMAHWSFFLALLDCSPWAGARAKRGAAGTGEAMKVDAPPDYSGMDLDEVLLAAEAQAGAYTASPFSDDQGGTRVLAQVLGFKFSYYQAPDVLEDAPKGLYFTAALLIREGYITVEDLYSHITPVDEEMDKFRKDYLATVDARIEGAKVSQLAMAAPLESTPSVSAPKSRPAPAPTPEAPKAPETKETPNQKLALTTALLAVGALRPALAIVSKFPWFVDAYPEVADLILRILRASIGPYFKSTVPQKEGNSSFTQPRARYGSGGVSAPAPRRPHLTLCAPTPPCTSAVDFVFFFPNWADRVPVCTSAFDMMYVVEPLMAFVKVHVSRDPSFLTKFTRLGRMHLTATEKDSVTKQIVPEPDPDNPTRQFWFNVLRVYLLPALSLIRGNAVCAVDIWNIVRRFDTTLRWQLYGEWKDATPRSHPELRVRAIQADRESKGIMRRLAVQTVDALSGPVAKLVHSNPCIFFANAVNQVMAYVNLADVVIGSLRFVTNMGFDVLAYVILDAMSNPRKERLKDDGVNSSDWLLNLASFTGKLFKKYGTDLTPVLRYIVHQLHNRQTTEIVVLRELILKMAGIEPLPSLSDAQITAMAGGPALRIEAVASTTRGVRLESADSASNRLGRTLLESSLALPLLIQVAQQRQACVFLVGDAHLKSLAGLFDATHGVLLQYLELLTSPNIFSPDEYSKIIPPLADLKELYGIAVPICMQIIRPILNKALLTAALAMQEQERVASEEAEKRLKAALTAKREPSSSVSRLASPAVADSSAGAENGSADKAATQDGQTQDVAMDVVEGAASTQPPVVTESPWVPEMEALFDDLKKVAPDACEVIGPAFYMTFWQLSSYDLAPPAARYDEECAALRTLSRQEDSKYIAADRSPDRTKRLTAHAHRVRRDKYNKFVSTLAQEFKEQTASRMFTLKRLAREKAHWFAHSPRPAQLAVAIIEHCLQPRCLLSPMDADFCVQVVKMLHTQGTPGFHTLGCYNKILGEQVNNVVFSCSEYEAKNYGRFLLGVLSDLWKWHQDEQAYTLDNRAKVGGKTMVLPGFQIKWSNKAVLEPKDVTTWSNCKQLLKKWHRVLCRCLTSCIETGEFMHVYNAIIVLKEILPVFPMAAVHEFSGETINLALEAFLKKEERGDLKILGRAYAASLKKREKEWQPPAGLPSKPAAASTSSAINRVSSPMPNGSALDSRRDAGAPPLAPRAQLANGAAALNVEKAPTAPGTPKPSVESIPKPQVVKRVRNEAKPPVEAPKANGEAKSASDRRSDAMDVDSSPPKAEAKPPSAPASDRDAQNPSKEAPRAAQHHIPERPAHISLSRSISQTGDISRPDSPARPFANGSAGRSGLPRSPRHPSSLGEPGTGGLPPQNMPPPTVPSQTPSAHGLRESARQYPGLQRPLPDKPDEGLPRDRERERTSRPVVARRAPPFAEPVDAPKPKTWDKKPQR